MHYWVSCAINKGGFFDIAFVVDTHLPCYEAIAYVLPHIDGPTHMVTWWFMCPRRSSLLFVYRKAYISICVCQRFVEFSKTFNTLSKILLWIKPSYFQHGSSLSFACINETGLFSSAAVVQQSKSTELCSCAVVVPHKVNLTEFSV